MSNTNNSKKRTAGAMSNSGAGDGGRGVRGTDAPPASSCADGSGEGISPDINIPLSLIRGLRRNMSSTGSVSATISGASGSGNNSDDNVAGVGVVGRVGASPPDVGGENSDNSGGSLSIGNNSFGFNFDSDEMNKIGTLPTPGGLTSSQSEKDSSTSGSDDAAKRRSRVGGSVGGGGGASEASASGVRKQEQKAVAGGDVASPSNISSSNDGGSSSSSRKEVDGQPKRTDRTEQKQAKLRGKAYYEKSKSSAGSSTVSSLTSNTRGSGGSQSSSATGSGCAAAAPEGPIAMRTGGSSPDGAPQRVTESSGGSGGCGPTSSSSSSPSSVPLGSKRKGDDAPRSISCKRNTSARHAKKSHSTDEKPPTEEPQQKRLATGGSKQKKTPSNEGGERSDDGSVGGYNSDDEACAASTSAQTAAGSSEGGLGGKNAAKAIGAPAEATSPTQPEAVLSSAEAEAKTPTKSSESTVTPTEGSGGKKRKEHPPSEKGAKKQKSAEDVKREERNAREKDRSFRISLQIDELRNLLSTGGVIVPKGTKSSVLTEAAGYIRMLQQHQYRSEIDRHQLVQQIQMIGSGALGPKAAEAVRHAAAKNGVWSLGNFGGMPPQSALTYPSQQEESLQRDSSVPKGTEEQPVLDVRQIKQVEKHEYRHIFNSCSVAIAIASMGGAFIDCNKVFCKLSGYSKQELCSMTIFNLTARVDLQSAFDRISSMITPAKTQMAKGGVPIAKPPPIVLRGSMKRRDDLGISVNVVRGDDGVLKCFCVTLMKDVPASGFSPSSRPILATIESVQLPSKQPMVVDKTNLPMQDTIKKPTSAAEVAAPTYTAG